MVEALVEEEERGTFNEDLLNYVGELRPARVLLVHGDDEAMAWMEAKIRENFPEISVSIPEPEQRIEL